MILTDAQIRSALEKSLGDPARLHRVLLIPPDFTRLHSDAGRIVRILWDLLTPTGCKVDILPALGSHVPMNRSEWDAMYGPIPYEAMIVHRWRTDCVTLGTLPGAFLSELSGGLMTDPVPVQLNRHLLDPAYDRIFSIGQVVPHEVVGMANRNKNLFVGCGGADMINASHMLGAFMGLENIMGRDHTPVRRLFDEAEAQFLGGEKTSSNLTLSPAPLPEGLRPGREIPLVYLLTVTTAPGGRIQNHGLFIGRERSKFEQAVALSQQTNLTLTDEPFQKAVVWLDPAEFKSTWLGNKAIYRTRMAMADGGELIILAPGVERFGEDPEIDRLIRKYGYSGRESIIRLIRTQDDLRANLSAAAHLIHGSPDGRFRVTYCTQHLSADEIRSVGYHHMPLDEALRRYNPSALREGKNTLPDGETIQFIPNPALGLWADKKKF